jgi:pilus assembly protein CpaC
MKCRDNRGTLGAAVLGAAVLGAAASSAGTLGAAMKRALCFAAVGALVLEPMIAPALAANRPVPAAATASGHLNARHLALGIGKSVVIDLPRDVKDVLVADPKIANAVVRSAQRAYIIGATVGQTNIVFFDAEGQQIAAYDIAVTRDLNGIRGMLKQILPNAAINVEGIGQGVVLTGSVASQAESQQAFDIAVRLVGDEKNVVNSLSVRGRDQVMLKVVVAEVQRNVI